MTGVKVFPPETIFPPTVVQLNMDPAGYTDVEAFNVICEFVQVKTAGGAIVAVICGAFTNCS